MADREAILCVAHGSRLEAGNDEFRALVRRVAARAAPRPVEAAFLEAAEPSVADGLARAARGADRVVVVPVTLFAALHPKRDIPREVEEARAGLGVDVAYARTLGFAPEVRSILEDRIAEAARRLPSRDGAALLLVAAGTSVEAENDSAREIARTLAEAAGLRSAGVAFTGPVGPSVADGLRAAAPDGRGVVVAPYLLFAGVYVASIGAAAEAVRRKTGAPVAVARHIGPDDRLAALVARRAREALAEDHADRDRRCASAGGS